MLYGGHIKSLEDIDFLRVAGFDFGEVVIRNKKARDYWKLSGIKKPRPFQFLSNSAWPL